MFTFSTRLRATQRTVRQKARSPRREVFLEDTDEMSSDEEWFPASSLASLMDYHQASAPRSGLRQKSSEWCRDRKLSRSDSREIALEYAVTTGRRYEASPRPSGVRKHGPTVLRPRATVEVRRWRWCKTADKASKLGTTLKHRSNCVRVLSNPSSKRLKVSNTVVSLHRLLAWRASSHPISRLREGRRGAERVTTRFGNFQSSSYYRMLEQVIGQFEAFAEDSGER